MPREVHVVSAHRTPDVMFDYARTAVDRGLRVIIAGAGGAAHLPGMTASLTSLPVIGVPVPLQHLDGLDSLLSIVQMPDGIPVATVGIGKARNAGLLAVRILGAPTTRCAPKLDDHRAALDAHRSRAEGRALSEGRARQGGEVGRALLDERGDAFDRRRAWRTRRRCLGLAGQVGLERVLERGVQETLRGGERDRRTRRELGRELGGGVVRARRRARPGDQTPVERLGRAEALGW